uniref:DUF4201 domain-containing protein n=1 Tax=Strongyloides venezuelensis TaxID=75913 RepID=A0A0K0FXG8_STRVS
MEKYIGIEEEISFHMSERTKNCINENNKHLLQSEEKAFKIGETSKVRYFLPPFDFLKITNSEFNKLDLLNQSGNSYSELSIALIKDAEMINDYLLKSINSFDMIPRDTDDQTADNSSCDKNSPFTTILEKLTNVYKRLENVKNDLLEKSEEIKNKNNQISYLQDELERKSEVYNKRMRCYIERKFENGKINEIERSLHQERTLHEISVYNSICKDIEKKIIEKIKENALCKENFKLNIRNKLRENHNMFFGNPKTFIKTKTNSKRKKISGLLMGVKVLIKETLNEELGNIEKLSREINHLKMREVNVLSNIKYIIDETPILKNKIKTLTDMKVKFEEFLNDLSVKNIRIRSVDRKKFLTQFSLDTCYSGNTSFGAIYLSMLDESKEI